MESYIWYLMPPAILAVLLVFLEVVGRRLTNQAVLAAGDASDGLVELRNNLFLRSQHPNISPELNALVNRVSSSSETVDMRQVTPGQVVRVVFDTPEEDHMELSFVVVRPADQNVFQGGEESEGRLLFIQLNKESERYFKLRYGGLPMPGHKVQIAGGCTWNPYSPMGCTMLHVEYIDRGRDLLWYVGENGVLQDLSVKSIFVYTPEEPFELPEPLEWEYDLSKVLADEEESVPEDRVHEFYVRTSTSVYWIRESEEGPLAPPVAEKIGLVSDSSVAVGQKMFPAKYIGIMKNMFICYNAESRTPPEKIEDWAIQASSSYICGVFLDRETALLSLRLKCGPWDKQLEESTKEALSAIGDEHPRFVVSKKLLANE